MIMKAVSVAVLVAITAAAITVVVVVAVAVVFAADVVCSRCYCCCCGSCSAARGLWDDVLAVAIWGASVAPKDRRHYCDPLTHLANVFNGCPSVPALEAFAAASAVVHPDPSSRTFFFVLCNVLNSTAFALLYVVP